MHLPPFSLTSCPFYSRYMPVQSASGISQSRYNTFPCPALLYEADSHCICHFFQPLKGNILVVDCVIEHTHHSTNSPFAVADAQKVVNLFLHSLLFQHREECAVPSMELRAVELLGENCFLLSEHLIVDFHISDEHDSNTRLSGKYIFIYPPSDFFQSEEFKILCFIDNDNLISLSELLLNGYR